MRVVLFSHVQGFQPEKTADPLPQRVSKVKSQAFVKKIPASAAFHRLHKTDQFFVIENPDLYALAYIRYTVTKNLYS